MSGNPFKAITIPRFTLPSFVAAVGNKFAAQQREQAGLAAAIGTDDAHLLARVHGQRRAVEQPPATASEDQVRNANHNSAFKRGQTSSKS